MPTFNLTRRSVLAGALASAVTPGRASAQSVEKVRVSIIPTNDVAPLFSAIHNGYFRELGLEVDTSPSTGGATGIPALIAGSFDVAYGNVVSTLLAVQQGLDLKVIAAGTKIIHVDTDTTSIIVGSESGIKNGKNLEGKSIAVNTRNNVIWLYSRAWIKKTGGDPDLVAYREVPFPQMEDALRQKRVDAAHVVAPFSVIATAKPGIIAIAKAYSEVQPGADVGQYATTGKFLAERPETVRKFAAGLRRGAEWFNANVKSEDVLNIITGYTKVNVAVLKTIDMAPAPLRCDLLQIKKTMDLMIENKLLSGPLDLTKIVSSVAL